MNDFGVAADAAVLSIKKHFLKLILRYLMFAATVTTKTKHADM